jgi:DinB family protein
LWDVTTARDEGAPPWGVRLTAELGAADERAIALARGLTPEQLNWKPDAGHWSVGQCLEHLYAANEVYLPPIAKALEGRPRAVVQDITPGWFGRWFMRRFIEPSPDTTKLRAPKTITPGERVDPLILDRFLDSNRKARELVGLAGGYDVNRIRFRNPFIPVIYFTVGTGLELISAHQRRHLLQAAQVLQRFEISLEALAGNDLRRGRRGDERVTKRLP